MFHKRNLGHFLTKSFQFLEISITFVHVSFTDNDVSLLQEYSQDKPTANEKSHDFCEHPEPPTNGRYKCDAKNLDVSDLIANLNGNTIENFQKLAPGSTCRAYCNRSYSIPYHLFSLSAIECTNGSWNTTGIEYCYKKEPQHQHQHRHLRHKNKAH